LGVGEDAAGKTVKCPKCKTPMLIPAPEPPAPPVARKKPAVKSDVVADDADERPRKKGGLFDAVEDDLARKKRRDDEDDEDLPRGRRRPADDDDRPRGRRRPVDDDDDDEDDRPRRKKGKKKAAGPPVGLLIGGSAALLLLLAGGGFAIYWFGFRDKDKSGDTAGTTNTGGGDGGGKAAVPSGWQELSPPGYGFRAYVPRLPPESARWKEPPPARVTRPTKSREFECPTEDDRFMFGVSVALFPDAMSTADREKWLADDLRNELRAPRQFTKETTGKTTLGGREANELRIEVDMAGFLATKGANIPKTGPKGQPIPDRVVAVFRYCVAGNRGYVAVVAALGSTLPETDAKAFFDNFEFIPVADAPAGGGGPAPKPKGKGPNPPTGSAPAGWKPFSPPDGVFKINVPGTARGGPYESNGKQSDSRWLYAVMPTGGQHLMCSMDVFAFPADWPPEKRAKYAAAEPNNQKTFRKTAILKQVTWAGQPATEIRPGPDAPPPPKDKFGSKDGAVTRVLSHGGRVYVFTLSSQNGSPTEAEERAFFDSFEILK
jgi:hypothetical protein